MKGKSETDIAVGRFVRRKRRAGRISQTELASLLGLHQSAIARLESGDQHCLFAWMRGISESLKFGLDEAAVAIRRTETRLLAMKTARNCGKQVHPRAKKKKR